MTTESGKPNYHEAFKAVLLFRALAAPAQDFLFERAEILRFEGGEKIVSNGDRLHVIPDRPRNGGSDVVLVVHERLHTQKKYCFRISFL